MSSFSAILDDCIDPVDIATLLKQIDELPLEKQIEIFSHIAEKLRRREYALSIIEKIKGRSSGEMDAQEYINHLRGNDRF